MLALSIRQPWAWLIINGGKDIENRTWPTKVRGRVLVHAAKGVTVEEWREAWDWVKVISPETWQKGADEIKSGTIERGGIIGSVGIVDCVRRSDSRWFQGQYGFVLKDPEPIPFIPYRGQLGFFNVEI